MPKNQELDIVTELESEQARRVEGDGKHQFDESGLKYEKRRHLIIWLLIFLAATIGMAYFLFNTETGRELLNLNSEVEGPTNNNFPVSYTFSSNSTSSSESQDSSSTRKSITVPTRVFENQESEQILEQMEADITEADSYAELEVLFEEFDSQVEFGTKPQSPKN